MALYNEFKKQGDFLFKNRSYLPLIFLLIGLSVHIYSKFQNPAIESAIDEYYEFICLGVSLMGLLIRVLTVGFTPKNTSGRNTKMGQVADELNTTGMYSVIRHPLYLGNFLMWLGVAMLTANLWFIISFIFLFWLYYERIMYAEESFLIEKFGNEYLKWSSHTPPFIPAFKKVIRPNYPFSVMKVLKKEKNGLAAIFLLFWLFEWFECIIAYTSSLLIIDFWFYAAISSSVLYLILKILKKKKRLDEIGR
ncbi:methyltransferase family protein [Flagellimonas zhangzhouensis]|uniref:Protein-S-isoprenylcysteine O-methyltransferase Ste14 n=1 Tax=Flagellimonas zhangzhouensis TaxID=1073328 RepID=A0A1H2YEE4_9FLAO|nr:isoprenylcysteine carboxylmethyltransferase family protein [Allomuricauda zhangzhouensis]SDQ96599.1 Protein-S-isoprenylcysteine O-methyltransferase Ste14 [Allomuricauda zhangzhouensis]SDX03391.1 Protein-S-isoprenylcysteine O-methyltransferase Ste14 [Allomuricauda zhangzhouensis]